jgi:hypothetical protein
MVCDKITPVVRPVISDTQHGFVMGRLTVSNLFQFTNGVIGEIEDEKHTVNILRAKKPLKEDI